MVKLIIVFLYRPILKVVFVIHDKAVRLQRNSIAVSIGIVGKIIKRAGFRQRDIKCYVIARYAAGVVDEGRDVAALVGQVLQSAGLTRLRDRSSIERVMRRVFLTLQATVSGDAVLEAGVAHTVEPVIYPPGIGYFPMNDIVLLTQEGTEVPGYFDRDLL